jgi:hypothetical protein
MIDRVGHGGSLASAIGATASIRRMDEDRRT